MSERKMECRDEKRVLLIDDDPTRGKLVRVGLAPAYRVDVVLWIEGAARLYGHEPHEIVGRSGGILLGGDGPPGPWRPDAAATSASRWT